MSPMCSPVESQIATVSPMANAGMVREVG